MPSATASSSTIKPQSEKEKKPGRVVGDRERRVLDQQATGVPTPSNWKGKKPVRPSNIRPIADRQADPITPAMTKGEREDLQRLVRQREKVLKSAAKQRSSELLADFENQMGQEYSFDQDAVWEQAKKAADREVQKAQKVVAARCRELGIPDRFAPSLSLRWYGRGYDNSIERRKHELRTIARTRIGAIEQKAITEIEMSCLNAQEQIALAGLTSDAARSFIDKLPGIETLMPGLSFAEIAGEAEPPVAEQLISSNALRQRRFRERQALRRNGSEALQALSRNDADGDDGEMNGDDDEH
jgi:hypothetical protein